jgi:hypothetical protein
MSEQKDKTTRTIKVTQVTAPPAGNPYEMMQKQYNYLLEEQRILREQVNKLQTTWDSLLNIANRSVVISQLVQPATSPQPSEPLEANAVPPVETKPPVKSTPVWERPERSAVVDTEPKPKKSSKGKWLLFGVLVLLIIGLITMYILYNQGYVFFWQAGGLECIPS